jgi:hypothetical protein
MKPTFSFLPVTTVIIGCAASAVYGTNAVLENRALRAELDPGNGTVIIFDKQTGTKWDLGAPEVTLKGRTPATVPLMQFVNRDKSALRYRREGLGEFSLKLVANPRSLEYSVVAAEDVKDLRLLSKALPLGPGENSYYAAPHRMGILLRAEGDKSFSRRFRDSCSMAMFGAVKEGSALLVTWTDPYAEVQVDYAIQPAPQLRMGLATRERAQSVRLQPLASTRERFRWYGIAPQDGRHPEPISHVREYRFSPELTQARPAFARHLLDCTH